VVSLILPRWITSAVSLWGQCAPSSPRSGVVHVERCVVTFSDMLPLPIAQDLQ